MRRLSAYTLLLLLIFSIAGYFLIFMYQQGEIRQAVKQRIKAGVPQEELVLIKVSAHQESTALTFVKDHEFRYKGALYDIVKKEVHGSTTWYYCLNDKMEEALFSGLDKEIAHNTSTGNTGRQRSKQVISLLTSVYLSSGFTLQHYLNNEREQQFFDIRSLPQEPDTRPLTPPPRVLFA